jgi:hypothetical protein
MRKKTLILAGIATLTAVTAVAAQQIPGIDAEAIERQAQKGSEALSGFVQQALERTPARTAAQARSSQQAPRPWSMRRIRCARVPSRE